MRAGVITGSGTSAWPGLAGSVPKTYETRWGRAALTEGTAGDTGIVHVARHEAGHRRLSNQINHRANLAALLERRVGCLISLTICGAIDPAVRPGSVIVFDDFYFPSNRLPDGSLCSWYTAPGEPGRGHWIFGSPFSDAVRGALIQAGQVTGTPVVDGGCYGHADGPRFSSRAEIAALAAAGVTAVSQTAGPEVVLAGEAELPMALAGFVTDYANGVREQAEPVEALLARMRDSTTILTALVEAALPRLGAPQPAGAVHRVSP